jgi:hypothetical protein
MDDLEVNVIRMTGPTEILQRLHQQLGLVRGVRVVARGAHAALDWEMNETLFPELLVAGVTEIRGILCELESLFTLLGMRRLHGLVAALAGFRDGMDGRALQQCRVTVRGSTTFLRDGVSVGEEDTTDHD